MAKKETKIQIEQYEHSDKERANNPHVGLVTPASDPDTGEKKTYQYDPHLDPQLQWAGKAEHTSFEVPTVSLHVHERIDPNSIIETVKKEHEGPTKINDVIKKERFCSYRTISMCIQVTRNLTEIKFERDQIDHKINGRLNIILKCIKKTSISHTQRVF